MCTTRMTYVEANLWLWNVLVISLAFTSVHLTGSWSAIIVNFNGFPPLILQAKPNLMLVPFGDHTETPFKHFVRPCLGLNCLTLLSYSGIKFELVYKAKPYLFNLIDTFICPYICTIYLLEHDTWKYKKRIREYAATIRHRYLQWQAQPKVQFKWPFYPSKKRKRR